MLTELSIKDFAIIDRISITFQNGLTVLTGETGAGKSIIIDAVGLLAGERGSVHYVRHGTKQAEIQGLFILDESNSNHPIYALMHEYGLEMEDGMLVIHRIITDSGKSICRVNGKLVTLTILKKLGSTLIDIHGQHETQTLMDRSKYIHLLDLYAQESIQHVKEEYTTLYDELQAVKKEYKRLSENEQEITQRLDLLQFQANELEQAELHEDEDVNLEKERAYLVNFEKIFLGVQDAYNALYGDRKGLEWLNKAKIALEENRSFDPFIAEKADKLTDHYFLIEELSADLRDFKDSLQFDTAQLDAIEERLDEINRLKRKYGSSVNEILEYRLKVNKEIEQIKNKDFHLTNLIKEIDKLVNKAVKKAAQLHNLRKKAAHALELDIHNELKHLYLENTLFSIKFHDKPTENLNENDLNHNGYDIIQFMISTNSGEPLKELNKVASGGELSRIMLALKGIFARHQGVTSVIFDEVDTGVSGRVAQAIAEKIYETSLTSQVLCITHLPQVASMADTHQLIEKKESESRTSTVVKELTINEKAEELSRMITGREITEAAAEHAQEMLLSAKKFKSKQKVKADK
ncbi:DNA repair protein RecN [Virgibacillus sp. W0181]|uniref:DNA repair protein RecN n=1 Tax=Virgibacillus sp. W0181 TaxID=3391581 RepID=UPI003F457C66